LKKNKNNKYFQIPRPLLFNDNDNEPDHEALSSFFLFCINLFEKITDSEEKTLFKKECIDHLILLLDNK
jgi:hypothetical protein